MTGAMVLHLASVVLSYTAGYIAAHAIFYKEQPWPWIFIGLAAAGVSIAFQIAIWVK